MKTLKKYVEKKINLQLQVAEVLETIAEKFPISQSAIECKQDNPFFMDSCNFVGLRHEVLDFSRTLKAMAHYSKMCKCNYEGEDE